MHGQPTERLKSERNVRISDILGVRTRIHTEQTAYVRNPNVFGFRMFTVLLLVLLKQITAKEKELHFLMLHLFFLSVKLF